MSKKIPRKQKIKYRIRKKISGTPEIPRISVFRSNAEIYAQIIDDNNRKTLVFASSKEKAFSSFKGTKTEKATAVGKLLAEKAINAGIKKVCFDRNGNLFHGRVKALAEAAREGGLQF